MLGVLFLTNAYHGVQIARRTRPEPPCLDGLFAAMTAALTLQRDILTAAAETQDESLLEMVSLMLFCRLYYTIP